MYKTLGKISDWIDDKLWEIEMGFTLFKSFTYVILVFIPTKHADGLMGLMKDIHFSKEEIDHWKNESEIAFKQVYEVAETQRHNSLIVAYTLYKYWWMPDISQIKL